LLYQAAERHALKLHEVARAVWKSGEKAPLGGPKPSKASELMEIVETNGLLRKKRDRFRRHHVIWIMLIMFTKMQTYSKSPSRSWQAMAAVSRRGGLQVQP